MKHVFGPVPSRRLGRSLGVDVVPYKTCTYDCIYCQLGRTTRCTLEREEWVPLEAVVSAVEAKLDTKPDYITLSGSGEPTLYSRLGELIQRIKKMTATPVAVLTNGSLLWRPDVQDDILHADVVLPSLDAGGEPHFKSVNRPCGGLSFDKIVGGLIEFRKRFRGQYWLEVFLAAGLTDSEEEVKKMAAIAKRIGPDRIQLNTVTRPPSDTSAMAVSPERMAKLARLFDPPAEVIADFRGIHDELESMAQAGEILDMLRRRPCTVEDIAQGLKANLLQVQKVLGVLEERGEVTGAVSGDKIYFSAGQPDASSP